MIEIGLIILLTISIILFIKYNNLTSKYKDMLKRKNSAENTSALYFNTLITYRDVIIRNNLTVPQNTEIPTEKKDNKKTFTVEIGRAHV